MVLYDNYEELIGDCKWWMYWYK